MIDPTLEPKSGFFIVVEGADGIGKSTQISMLRSRFEGVGKKSHYFDFPSKGNSPIGDLIGDFLRGSFGEISPEFLSLAFSIDRAQHRERFAQIRIANEIAIFDRYVLSNIAFQETKLRSKSAKRRIRQLIEWVEYETLGLPKPELEIVLTAPDDYFSHGKHLIRESNEEREYAYGAADIHESSNSLQMNVNRFYLNLDSSKSLKKIEIFGKNGLRKNPTELHQELWGFVIEATNAASS